MIPLFHELEIETMGGCTRACPTCLRTTYPHRKKLRGRFGPDLSYLPLPTIKRVISEAAAMSFHGILTLQFFNEPLKDFQRVVEAADFANEVADLEMVRIFSNGDWLDADTAKALDGHLDQIEIALYAPGPGGKPRIVGRQEREDEIRAWFKTTNIVFTGGSHMTTHYSPNADLGARIAAVQGLPCVFDVQERMIVSHTGEMLLCCDDIGAEFELGSVNDASLDTLWYSEKHQEIVKALALPGGRAGYPYCRSCPRNGDA